LYDCEKCKVVLRKTRLWGVILGLELEFKSVCCVKEKDDEYLQDAVANVDVVKKLLGVGVVG
jgi:hypothetical protein